MDFVLGMFFGMFVSYIVVKFVVWRTMHEINQMLLMEYSTSTTNTMTNLLHRVLTPVS